MHSAAALIGYPGSAKN